MLLKQNSPGDQTGPRSASIIVHQQSQPGAMTLKEKLLMQQQERARQDNGPKRIEYHQVPMNAFSQPQQQPNQQQQPHPPPPQQQPHPPPQLQPRQQQLLHTEVAVAALDDVDLDRKFSKNAGCRARSMAALDVVAKDVIDIDLDFENTEKTHESEHRTAEMQTLLSRPVEQYSAIHKIDDIMGPPVLLPAVDRATRPNFNCHSEHSNSQPATTKTSYVNKYKQQLNQPQLPQQQQQPHFVARQPDVVALPRQPDPVSLPPAKTTSIRISQLITESDKHAGCQKTGSGRVASNRRQASLLNHEQGVTGSFDASDFDSFDEDEDGNRSYRPSMMNHDHDESRLTMEVINAKKLVPIEQAIGLSQAVPIPLEPMEKIREEALLQQRMEEERAKQAKNMVQFDPDDFDSFDEEEYSRASRDNAKWPLPEETLPAIQLGTAAEGGDEVSTGQKEPEEECRHSENFISNRNRIEAMFKNSSNSSDSTGSPVAKVARDSTPVLVRETTDEAEFFQENGNFSGGLVESAQENNADDNNVNFQFDAANHGGRSEVEQFSEHVFLQEEQQPEPRQPGMLLENAKPATGFFRSALERMSGRSRSKSSKSRSSSVPLRKYMLENNYNVSAECELADCDQLSTTTTQGGNLPNLKTLQLMTKLQNDLDEKNKRRQHRQRQNRLDLLQKKSSQMSKSSNEIDQQAKTPTSDRKFLSSIMNTLFSGSSAQADNDPGLQKNEARRLSLRKLKAKDKMKKKECDGGGEEFCDDLYDGGENAADEASTQIAGIILFIFYMCTCFM